MRERIIAASDGSERETAERCYVLEQLNSPEDPAVSVARARVKPGVRTSLHRLRGVDERYVILEGRGQVEVGQELRGEISQGDVVWIPHNTSQRITNVGSSDLVFLCICTPRFTPECYEDLENLQP